MTPFVRQAASRWHDEVPGARWFKTDLHLHTLDDHPSTNLQMPAGVVGSSVDPATLTGYARAFLKGAIANGIEVLGLTPHAVKCGDGDDTSAVWRIVEVWNNDSDDDGVPFREKIYAVFPGFEPNLVDGDQGLHLLFLFDPEIGRADFIAAFSAVMGAIPPWKNGSLQISSNDSKTAFGALTELHKRLNPDWDYICVAPHAFSGHGLFTLKSQVLATFPHRFISAIELKDNWLPADAFADKPWLKAGMEQYRHALFHSSDAYSVSNIGKRFTLTKLARPRIAALKQAFLASDSRLRIAYNKNGAGALMVRPDLPDPRAGNRPWLRSIQIRGGTSFFAGTDTTTNTEREQTFRFNPDLTCIIGGRMSGKSTLLDGLRLWFGHELPAEPAVHQDVEQRARSKFLSGDPNISVVIRGPTNPAAQNKERWPARFYTQRELQKAVRDQTERRQVLYRLIPAESPQLLNRAQRIAELDAELSTLADEAEELRTSLAATEQAFVTVKRSKDALERFAAAGVDKLTAAQADQGRIKGTISSVEKIKEHVDTIVEESASLTPPPVTDADLKRFLEQTSDQPGLEYLLERKAIALRYAAMVMGKIRRLLEKAETAATTSVDSKRTEVQRAVIAAGGTAEELNQFDALTQSAGEYEVRHSEFSAAKQIYFAKLRLFCRAREERSKLITEQRSAMDRVAQVVLARFPDKIRINKRVDAEADALEEWIFSLREQGVTRWWNSRKSAGLPTVSPEVLRAATRNGNLGSVGMSDQVTRTFQGLLTQARRCELYALRNEDKYEIELKVGSGANDYREIDALSGGAQVSVLVSLVLETDDTNPLVVDQPEDELDKAYLFETLLPALRRLKGRRQVIFATHDANIVVNGDADQVIYLQADHQFGRIAEQGTIEEQRVKEAIVNILDGGRDAFTLRQAKYGF